MNLRRETLRNLRAIAEELGTKMQREIGAYRKLPIEVSLEGTDRDGRTVSLTADQVSHRVAVVKVEIWESNRGLPDTIRLVDPRFSRTENCLSLQDVTGSCFTLQYKQAAISYPSQLSA